jgi:hypothetical protein
LGLRDVARKSHLDVGLRTLRGAVLKSLPGEKNRFLPDVGR